MHRAHKAVEKTAVDAAILKQLTHIFQRVHRVLECLSRESVHQVGVHQNTGLGHAACDTGHLFNRDPFLHQGQQPVRGDLQSARQGNAAALRQQFAELGGEGFFKPDIAPPTDLHLTAQQFFSQRFEHLGGRCFIDEMKTGLSGLGHDAFNAIDQGAGAGCFVAADVVQAHIAKTALFPVTAVGHGQLVPAPIAPQAVHGVEHVQQAQVLVDGQAIPRGRAHVFKGNVGFGPMDIPNPILLSHKGAYQPRAAACTLQMFNQGQHGAFTAIQGDEVDKVKQTRLGQLAQLGVDKAPTQRNPNIGMVALDRLCHAQGAVDRTREGDGQQHQLRLMLCHGGQGQVGQVLVDEVVRRGQCLGQGVEAGLRGGKDLGVAHKFEACVHRIAQHIGQVVEIERGQVPGTVVLSERTKGPTQRVTGHFIVKSLQGGEARTFGQKPPACHAV